MKNYFTGISKTAQTMCKVLAGMFVLALAVGLAVILLAKPFEKPVAYAIGLIAGFTLSSIKVLLLEKSLNNAIDMNKDNAKNYGTLQAVLRYGLTIAVFACVVLFPNIVGIFGTIIGVLSLQFSAYIAGIILRAPKKPKTGQTDTENTLYD